MGKRRKIGELELEILHIIRSKSRASVNDVLSMMKNRAKYTTVMTVMQRLFEKGELMREKVGRCYEYWIDETSRKNHGLLKRLKEKIFAGKTSAMVAYLLDMDEEISPDELDAIETLLEKKRGKHD